MNNFEDTASFLLPHCPVAKKRNAGSKRDIANISDINATDDKGSGRWNRPAGKSPKKGIGKTGVHFRFYGLEEYKKLSKEQKEEVREHLDAMESNGKGRKLSKGDSSKSNTKSAKQIASAMAAQIDKRIEDKMKTAETEAASVEQLKDYIISLVSGAKATTKTNASSAAALPPAPGGTAPSAPLVNFTADHEAFRSKEMKWAGGAFHLIH